MPGQGVGGGGRGCLVRGGGRGCRSGRERGVRGAWSGGIGDVVLVGGGGGGVV